MTVSLLWSSVSPPPQRRGAARLSSAVARLAGYLPVRHTHATNPSTAQHFRLPDCALTYLPQYHFRHHSHEPPPHPAARASQDRPHPPSDFPQQPSLYTLS
ncbi:hypothetical protein BDW02DRAFT_346211 [Decorospora gaudefroyi]|uniref:Uncharacterized protein n=1 Tax=Decorospora gaudefroyi TaxID=184978 RepID=A0A6A5KD62_9PLEO|nr:hypothetical protein BDW02DRAFT_346211 [Decorospora gaudefroyi]